MTDLGNAIRGLRRSPGFTAVAISLVALGAGAATVVFAIVDAILLRPLPYASPERLVAVFTVERDGTETRNPTSPANFLDLREGVTSFETLVAARTWSPTLTGGGQPERVAAILSTADLFELLGVAPHLGRTFDSASDADAAVAVIGYGLWHRRFGGSRDAVGSTIEIDGTSYTVIGVMPETFRFPPFWATDAELWAPLRMPPAEWSRRGASYLRLFGRLRANTDIERATAETEAVAGRLAAMYPETNSDTDFNIELLREPSVADSRTALVVLSGAVILLLLIASANLMNLLLGRVVAARRDTAVRIALGAGSMRLLRQWVTESALLALLGAAAGLVLATWSLQALLAVAADALPTFRTVSIDGRVAVFTLAAALVVGLMSGTLPALRALRGDVFEGLRGRGSGEPRDGRARSWLATAEVALATMLVIGAALLTRTFLQLSDVEPGFDSDGVITASISFGNGSYDDPESQRLLIDDVLERVDALPGVERVGPINHLPIGGDLWRVHFARETQAPVADADLPSASYRVAGPGWFETMRIPLLTGRLFDARDGTAAPRVALVNRTLADRFFGGDAVGRRIRFGGDSDDAPLLEIVGVVGDVRQAGLAEPVLPEIFLPYLQNPDPWFTFTTIVARAADPAATGRAIAATVAEIDPMLPVFDVRPVRDVLAADLRRQRMNSLLTALFASGALLLSAIGVYAVIAQLTRQKRHEMAVRLALGADPGAVLGLVVRHGLLIAAAGTTAGMAAAAAVARPAAALLFGVTAWDLPTYALVAAFMTLICLAASVVPALRASRTSPVAALKHD